MFDFDFLKKPQINLRFILILIIAVILIFYIFDLLFGERSFSRMVDLDNSLKKLHKKVENLKKENATLQKEYFELKELEGN